MRCQIRREVEKKWHVVRLHLHLEEIFGRHQAQSLQIHLLLLEFGAVALLKPHEGQSGGDVHCIFEFEVRLLESCGR